MVLLGPTWMPAAIALFALGLTVCIQLELKPLNLPESRWVVAALFGSFFASLLAPSLWVAAFLLTVGLSCPVSLIAFRRRWITEIGSPVYGVIALSFLAVWVIALGVLSRSLSPILEVFLAGLLVCATLTNSIAAAEVYFGLNAVRHTGFSGPEGEILRAPVGFLHSRWRPAAINAILLPVAFGLAWSTASMVAWSCLLVVILGMVWHLQAAKTTTATAAAFAGVLAILFAKQAYLALAVVSPLALVSWPSVRAGIKGDPRLEIWSLLWSRVKQDRFLGRGIGAWAGAGVRGTVETERVWLWAHSDWLEALYDCGPLPVLVALGFLVEATWRAWGGLPPLQAGLYGSLIALAVVSAGYMPWRTWPVNLVGLSVLAAWLA